MKRVLWMKLLSMVVCLSFFMGGYTTTLAGEWNEKPIMCANEIETFDTIKTKKEELIFKALQFTKVRNETGLAKRPVGVAVDMYVKSFEHLAATFRKLYLVKIGNLKILSLLRSHLPIL